MQVRSALVAIGCSLVAALLNPVASAASSTSGAHVNRVNECLTSEYGVLCLDIHFVSYFNETPSGNTVLVTNGRYTIDFEGANGACSSYVSGQEHFHATVNGSGGRFIAEYRFASGCTGGIVTVCQTVYHFQQVKGSLVFERTTGSCREETAA